MIRKRTGLVLALFTLLALVAAPASAQYPPVAPSVGVSDASPQAGEALTVSGECPPGSEVVVSLVETGDVLATTEADSEGNFATDVTIPADLESGDYTLRVQCDGQTADTTVQVAGAGAEAEPEPEPTPDPALAVTGLNSGLGALLGVGLLGAGAGALLIARRRQANQRL